MAELAYARDLKSRQLQVRLLLATLNVSEKEAKGRKAPICNPLTTAKVTYLSCGPNVDGYLVSLQVRLLSAPLSGRCVWLILTVLR